MGGTGIGISHGAESALANPAMITSVKGSEISFGGTLFMPDVQTDVSMGSNSVKSDADMSVIPEVAIAQKVSDNFSWGIGMFGTAGMGTDYRDQATMAGNYQMVTNLQLMQFAVPLAYTNSGLTVAFAPIMQYGSLDINFNNGSNIGTGVAQDFGLGYSLGAGYTMGNLTLGAVYKSSINMTYDRVLTTAAAAFSLTDITNDLEQPAELGAGLSYKMGANTFAFDFKQIKWSDANGYKQFGWDDQNVYAFGYAYNAGNWTGRVGYNYAKSPIKELPAAGGVGTAKNVLNLLGFPAIVEEHYTIGGTYNVSKQTSVDLAYVYVPETTAHYNASAGAGYNTTTKHSQDAVSVQLNFTF